MDLAGFSGAAGRQLWGEGGQGDTVNLRIIDLKKQPSWQPCFEEYRSFILKAYKSSKNIENYSPKRLKVESCLGFFLFFDEDRKSIAGFLSVAEPAPWPKGAARIDSRYWADPHYRLKGLSAGAGTNPRQAANWGCAAALEPQISCCRENNIALAAITRENASGPGRKNSLPALYKKWKLKRGWNLAENYFLTCLNKEDYKCWQRLVYRELAPAGRRLLAKIPQISPEEYKKRFAWPAARL